MQTLPQFHPLMFNELCLDMGTIHMYHFENGASLYIGIRYRGTATCSIYIRHTGTNIQPER